MEPLALDGRKRHRRIDRGDMRPKEENTQTACYLRCLHTTRMLQIMRHHLVANELYIAKGCAERNVANLDWSSLQASRDIYRIFAPRHTYHRAIIDMLNMHIRRCVAARLSVLEAVQLN